MKGRTSILPFRNPNLCFNRIKLDLAHTISFSVNLWWELFTVSPYILLVLKYSPIVLWVFAIWVLIIFYFTTWYCTIDIWQQFCINRVTTHMGICRISQYSFLMLACSEETPEKKHCILLWLVLQSESAQSLIGVLTESILFSASWLEPTLNQSYVILVIVVCSIPLPRKDPCSASTITTILTLAFLLWAATNLKQLCCMGVLLLELQQSCLGHARISLYLFLYIYFSITAVVGERVNPKEHKKGT